MYAGGPLFLDTKIEVAVVDPFRFWALDRALCIIGQQQHAEI